jgi:hypothetical protein
MGAYLRTAVLAKEVTSATQRAGTLGCRVRRCHAMIVARAAFTIGESSRRSVEPVSPSLLTRSGDRDRAPPQGFSIRHSSELETRSERLDSNGRSHVLTGIGSAGGATSRRRDQRCTKNAAEATHTARLMPTARKINVRHRSAAGDAFFPRRLAGAPEALPVPAPGVRVIAGSLKSPCLQHSRTAFPRTLW